MKCVAYVVDLEARKPQVMEYSGSVLAEDMEFFQARRPTDLTTPDWRVFETEAAADEFLRSYQHVNSRLAYYFQKESGDHPCMPLRRRYLILAALGLKTMTERSYNRGWKRGQRFTFHDQTYFLDCILTRMERTSDGNYRYHYRLDPLV